MTGKLRSFLALIFCMVVLLLASPAMAQFVQISFPDDGTLISGTAVLIATQVDTTLSPLLVSSVQFQYSPDGQTWTNIGSAITDGNGTNSQSPLDWQVLWDTTTVSAGTYLVRATFNIPGASENGWTTNPIRLTVNLPPVAVASGSFFSSDQVQFTGASSFDPDGSIGSWEWDFGDGSSGSGPVVSHTYAPGTYTAVLTVKDNQGAPAAAYLAVDTVAQVVQPQVGCIATSIALGTTGNAIGSDGKGSGWPARKDADDGKTRGPLQKNPSNKDQKWWGYALEVIAGVNGNPAFCVEIQIVRGTYISAPNDLSEQACAFKPGGKYDKEKKICTFYSGWSGLRNDFNRDGTLDLDVSDMAKCKAQGGFWWETRGFCYQAAFPVDKPNYKPDEESENSGGYRQPFLFKSHVGQQILWWDTPMVTSVGYKPGFTYDANFVAIIRGTDDKYCYDSFTVKFELGTKDSEKAEEVKKECGVDKSKVPGLK